MNQVRGFHATSILHPKKCFLILLNCATLKFVSYTSNVLEQMYDFPKRTMFLQKWILSLQDLPRSPSLETVPVCIVWQYYPHNTTVNIHMCHEFWISNEIIVCHKLFCPFLIDRANLFTDQRISGLPIRAKYEHFRTIGEHTFDNFPTDLK